MVGGTKVMVLYPNEYFEDYWERRKYRHPKQTNEDKKKARIFFNAGFNTGSFLERELHKRVEELEALQK